MRRYDLIAMMSRQPYNPIEVRTGRWVKQQQGPEPFSSFIPVPLPPDPPIHYDIELQTLEEQANRALGRLEGISILLPDPHLFIYTYIRKEAVLSSHNDPVSTPTLMGALEKFLQKQSILS